MLIFYNLINLKSNDGNTAFSLAQTRGTNIVKMFEGTMIIYSFTFIITQ